LPRSNVCSTRDLENPSASVHLKRFSTPSLTLKFLCAGKLNPRFLLLDDTKITAPTRIILGRPSFKWDEFHLEIAERLQKGVLPTKQKAFISEMQQWCKTQWGREVARSTLLQKIKPYYDAFVRAEKSE
jgi:hypothetical protein